jgi:hypothetical protein
MKLSESIRKVDVPEAGLAPWKIERFTLTKVDAEKELTRAALRAWSGERYIPVPEGTYTRLKHGDVVVMSDTPSEMRDHRYAIYKAQGKIFVAGLGLGMVVQAMLDKPDVEKVTVVELSEKVIKLVGPHYQERYGDRLDIQQGDALTWTPPRGTHHDPFDVAWFDIWTYKSEDNLEQITKIKRRWHCWAKWRGFWAEGEIRARRERRRC